MKKNITVEYLVDIFGIHDAPIDTLIDEKHSKSFDDPYKAIDFLNNCTYPTNIEQVIKEIECDYDINVKEELLLDKKEFIKFTDNFKIEEND
jgi:hypothetical protein